MKYLLTLIMVVFVFGLYSQHTSVYYNDGYNHNDSNYYNDQEDDWYQGRNDRRPQRTNNRARYRDDWRSRRIVERMSRRDKRKLLKLERKLIELERRAWRDGRINRRENRDMWKVKNKIDVIYDRYARYNYRSNRGTFNGGYCR